MKARSKFLIYLLKDPRGCEVKYIGATTRGTERPRECLRNKSHPNPAFNFWLKQMRELGFKRKFLFEIVEELEGPELLFEREAYWIRYYLKEFPYLFNRWKNPSVSSPLKGKKGHGGRPRKPYVAKPPRVPRPRLEKPVKIPKPRINKWAKALISP